MLADGDGKIFSDVLNQALFLTRHTPYHTDQGPKVKQEDVTQKDIKTQKLQETKWVYFNRLI